MQWLLLLGINLVPLSAKSYVLSNAFLNSRSVDFIQKVSTQLYEKTGVSLYVVLVDHLKGEKEEREKYKHTILAGLKEPYGVIFFIKSHKKIDIVLKPKINSINPDTIITEYMVPILIQDKKLTDSTLSAATLNGYAQLADEIATHFHQELPDNIIVDKSGAKNFVHYSFLTMLGLTFILVLRIYLLRRKKG
ncbi:TPM domain-containing protein [Helicobacter cholecystus]|uniref:TPM domain-containing protein n=1 Tax=Helicobacter cholecystus TaxID=45498 RepID=UPI0014739377|nr:TPM domain-containing protein [Helicobacter cholecystus]